MNIPSSYVITLFSFLASFQPTTSSRFETTFAIPTPSSPTRVSKSTKPYSLRLVSANASTKYVPKADETKRVPMLAEGDVSISTATEWAVDSTTVYALENQ